MRPSSEEGIDFSETYCTKPSQSRSGANIPKKLFRSGGEAEKSRGRGAACRAVSRKAMVR